MMDRCASIEHPGWLALREQLWSHCSRAEHLVDGAASSPVPFLEGIYVTSSHRRLGYAKRLMAAVAEWATAAGYSELASDARLSHTHSHAVHRALGFDETERVVFFRRTLP